MNRFVVVARAVVALALASIVTSTLAGCTGASRTVPPASIEPSAAGVASAPPSARATPSPSSAAGFPTAAFAKISLDRVTEATVATFQATLDDMAVGGGMSATVMTAEGTWSGAAGKADGVHDVEVDSQFGIASVTKSVIAAQVMQMVEAGELSLDEQASDHLPADFAFDTNRATIRQLLDMRSGIPDWYGDAMEAEVAKNRTREWKPAECWRSLTRLVVRPAARSNTRTRTTTCSGS